MKDMSVKINTHANSITIALLNLSAVALKMIMLIKPLFTSHQQ